MTEIKNYRDDGSLARERAEAAQKEREHPNDPKEPTRAALQLAEVRIVYHPTPSDEYDADMIVRAVRLLAKITRGEAYALLADATPTARFSRAAIEVAIATCADDRREPDGDDDTEQPAIESDMRPLYRNTLAAIRRQVRSETDRRAAHEIARAAELIAPLVSSSPFRILLTAQPAGYVTREAIDRALIMCADTDERLSPTFAQVLARLSPTFATACEGVYRAATRAATRK